MTTIKKKQRKKCCKYVYYRLTILFVCETDYSIFHETSTLISHHVQNDRIILNADQ